MRLAYLEDNEQPGKVICALNFSALETGTRRFLLGRLWQAWVTYDTGLEGDCLNGKKGKAVNMFLMVLWKLIIHF